MKDISLPGDRGSCFDHQLERSNLSTSTVTGTNNQFKESNNRNTGKGGNEAVDERSLFARLNNVDIEDDRAISSRLSESVECSSDAQRPRSSPVTLADVVISCPSLNCPKGEGLKFYEPLDALPPTVNVFMGIGLGSPKGMSKGLPIDLLNMIFLAEGIGADKHVAIADQTAINNMRRHPESFTASNIDQYVHTVTGQLENILFNLGLENWHIYRESELQTDINRQIPASEIELPKDLKEEVIRANRDPLYFQQQYAITHYFRHVYDCQVKVGWCFGDEKGANEQFSEAGFDMGYGKQAGIGSNSLGEMKFVYSGSGRTFDPGGSRSSPYVCLDSSRRVLLFDSEDIDTKLNSFDDMRANSKKRTQHVYDKFQQQAERIVDSYNWLVETGKIVADPINQDHWQDNIKTLVNRCEGG